MSSIARRARVVAVRLLAVLCLISAATFLCLRLMPANATTAGFAYLIAVLLIAATWGMVEATAASVVAMLCFNYYFLPPVRTLTEPILKTGSLYSPSWQPPSLPASFRSAPTNAPVLLWTDN